ncbi:hypothetical protein FKM82_009153 [Ascaphus truei]
MYSILKKCVFVHTYFPWFKKHLQLTLLTLHIELQIFTKEARLPFFPPRSQDGNSQFEVFFSSTTIVCIALFKPQIFISTTNIIIEII